MIYSIGFHESKSVDLLQETARFAKCLTIKRCPGDFDVEVYFFDIVGNGLGLGLHTMTMLIFQMVVLKYQWLSGESTVLWIG